jgi:hypothetical protein
VTSPAAELTRSGRTRVAAVCRFKWKVGGRPSLGRRNFYQHDDNNDFPARHGAAGRWQSATGNRRAPPPLADTFRALKLELGRRHWPAPLVAASRRPVRRSASAIERARAEGRACKRKLGHLSSSCVALADNFIWWPPCFLCASGRPAGAEIKGAKWPLSLSQKHRAGRLDRMHNGTISRRPTTGRPSPGRLVSRRARSSASAAETETYVS